MAGWEGATESLRLEGGLVRGRIEGGILALKGVPYAAPPVGPLRFCPPAPVVPWEGVREALDHESCCAQPLDVIEVYPARAPRATIRVAGEDQPVIGSEDCLYLNIWRPADGRRDLPIMVYIPGGAFIVGGASDFYSGARLAAEGVVVVTLSYRLGLFGFLELGALDPALKGSGNNGLRDQIAALDWVRRNAAALGGDADCLTLFGESAGSASVAAILSLDRPETRLRRAIAQSGGTNFIHTAAAQAAVARAILEAGPARSLAALRAASTLDLLAQQARGSAAFPLADVVFAPYVDGDLLPGDPAERLASGVAARVDLMAGSTANEMNYWALYDPAFRNPVVEPTDAGAATPFVDAPMAAEMDATLGPLAPAYARALGTADPRTLAMAVNDDAFFTQATLRLAEAQAAAGARSWSYRFAWSVPPACLPAGTPDLGAIHAIDIPFVFGTLFLDWLPGGAAARAADGDGLRALSDQMARAWANFARTGDPNGPGVPDWPAFDLTRRATMIWNRAPGSVLDPEPERRAIWAGWPFAARDLVAEGS